MITPSFGITATERVLPRLALDFTTASLDPRVTFTRTGNTATVTNSSGNVVPINADLPRFDYNPITLVCKGLLIEESRTNLMTFSEDFGSVGWVKTASSVSSDSTTSPGGTLTADTLVENTATAFHFIQSPLFTTVSGTAYTQSWFVKAAGRTTFYISYVSGAGFAAGTVQCNLDTKTITAVTGAATGTLTEVGNGWFRVTLTQTATSSVATNKIQLVLQLASYTGDGVSGMHLWGAQVEAGAFATSYIPNLASGTTTRNADVATMTGTNFSDWYNAGSGGVVARALPSTVSGTRPALQFDDATANEVIALQGNTTNPELVIVDGGSPQAQIDAGTIAANTAYNLGAAWNTDNCAAAVNGNATVTDNTATIPTVTQARLGSDGTNYLNGHIQTIRYWPQRIINAEVQAFSK
jgi:hypothetical protein